MVPRAEVFLFGYVQLLGCELELTWTKIGVFQRAWHFIRTHTQTPYRFRPGSPPFQDVSEPLTIMVIKHTSTNRWSKVRCPNDIQESKGMLWKYLKPSCGIVDFFGVEGVSLLMKGLKKSGRCKIIKIHLVVFLHLYTYVNIVMHLYTSWCSWMVKLKRSIWYRLDCMTIYYLLYFLFGKPPGPGQSIALVERNFQNVCFLGSSLYWTSVPIKPQSNYIIRQYGYRTGT